MSILNYLPTPSEYSAKVAEALKPYENDLYVVGSAARKHLYGLKSDIKDYNFVISTEQNIVDVRENINLPKNTLNDALLTADCEVFTLTLRAMPIEKFLFGVRFAGDGLAVKVSDGRPIVIPEYMTLPPVVAIIKTEDTDPQNDKTWVDAHLQVLAKFQEELFNLVNVKLDEPAKS